VDPTLAQQPSPNDFYTNFSGSAKRTAEDIKSFAKLLGDTQSKDILNRSRESRASNPENIQAWIVTDHEDWLEVKAEDSEDNMIIEEEVEEIPNYALNTKVENIRAVIDSYRENHPGIEILLDERSMIKVGLLSKMPS